MTRGLDSAGRGGRIAFALVALALLMRLLVPVGWMPAAEQGFAITLCTGEGAVSAWVDDKGEIHKGKPAAEQTSHPCIFAGFGVALDLPSFTAIGAPLLLAAEALPPFARFVVAIGQGLAAPPPPSTGPPIIL